MLGGRIISGVAVNVNSKETMQLEMMGFTIDKSGGGVCEGLGIFNLQVFEGVNPIIFLMRDFAFRRVKELDIKKLYGTCSEKKLRGYSILGWKPIDERIFYGEKKYLLEIPL